MNYPSLTAACQCGAVHIEAQGAPIVHAACYCASCQAAGRLIGDRPGAPAVLWPDGGTDLVLYRKDRVRCVQGADRLEVVRLKPESPTRRLVATCCNSAMVLDFTKGHWVSIFRGRLPQDGVPPLQVRVMTAARPQGVDLPQDTPNYPGFPAPMAWKFIAAWAAMGFRVPKVTGLPS